MAQPSGSSENEEFMRRLLEQSDRASEAIMNQFEDQVRKSVEGNFRSSSDKASPKNTHRSLNTKSSRSLYPPGTDALHYQQLFTGDYVQFSADAYLLQNLSRSALTPTLISTLSRSAWRHSQLADKYPDLMSENAFTRRAALADFQDQWPRLQKDLQKSAERLIGTDVFFWKADLPVTKFDFDTMSKSVFGMMQSVPEKKKYSQCVTSPPRDQLKNVDWSDHPSMFVLQPNSGTYADAMFYSGEECGLKYAFTDSDKAELFEKITSSRALRMFYFGQIVEFSPSGAPVFAIKKVELLAQNRQTVNWELTPFSLTVDDNPTLMQHIQRLVDAEAAKDINFSSAKSIDPSKVTGSRLIWSADAQFGGQLYYQFFDEGAQLYLRYDSNSTGTSYGRYQLTEIDGIRLYKMTGQSGRYRKTGLPGALFQSSDPSHRAWKTRSWTHFGLYATDGPTSIAGLTRLDDDQFTGDFRESYLEHRKTSNDTR